MTKQQFDLEQFSIEEVETLLVQGQAIIEQRKKEAIESAKAQIREIAQEHGIQVSFGETKTPSAKKTRAKRPPKYRNPDDSSQTWNGIGARPKWLKAKIEAGITLDDMLI